MISRLNPSLFVILGIATTALAQIILKSGSSFDVLSRKWILYLGLSLSSYGISFVSYYLALKFFEITKVAPIMMVSTLGLVALYGFWSGESFNPVKLCGILMAIMAIIFIVRS